MSDTRKPPLPVDQNHQCHCGRLSAPHRHTLAWHGR